MRKGRSESSSDLAAARQIAHRLHDEGALEAAPEPKGAPAYVKFSAKRVLPADEAPPRIDRPAPASAPAEVATEKDRMASTEVRAEPSVGGRAWRRPIPPAPDLAEVGLGAEGWDALLRWCLEVAGGDAAFVLDPQAFVIAHCGAITAEGAADVGARLMIAREHADPIRDEGAPPVAICIDVGGRWLNGFLVEGADDFSITVGVFGANALTSDGRRAIAGALARAIER
jgi:hypothetical protein